MRKPKIRPCPRCGTGMVPIVYGFPSPDMIRRAERGEIHIGGCLVDPDGPRFHCRTCARKETGEDEPE